MASSPQDLRARSHGGHKAVIRGILIKHGSRVIKAREAQLTKLLADIQVLELQHKRTAIPSLGTELAHLRRQVSDLLQYKAKSSTPTLQEDSI